MIIDSSGRLFGLINLFDLFIIIAAILVTYMGVTYYVVFTRPAISLQDMAPKQLVVGETPFIDLTIINEKRIESAKVKLISQGFEAPIIELAGRTDKRNRNWVGFNVPAVIQSGQYMVELDVTTISILNRKSLYKDINDKKQLLTVHESKDKIYPIMIKLKLFGDNTEVRINANRITTIEDLQDWQLIKIFVLGYPGGYIKVNMTYTRLQQLIDNEIMRINSMTGGSL